MRIYLFILILVNTLPGFSQRAPQQKYDWEKQRERMSITPQEQNHPEYILKLYRGCQYVWENGDLLNYQTDHRITRVSTTNAIERHNRIYISMRNVVEIVTLKARSINSAGRVTNFDEKNLKEVKDEETDNTYRIFAIEGVEADSEIEYIYTLKIKGRTYESYYIQQETPIREAQFQLTCPKSLKFDFRTYNDDHKILADTVSGQNRYQYHLTGIPGLNHESFTFFDAYRKRLELKLAYNFSSSSARLNTWADAGRVFYKLISKMDKDTEKDLTQFIKSCKDDPKLPAVTRIKQIEDKIKNGFRVNENSSDPLLDDVGGILKSRQASGEGITKLFFITYERIGIPLQLVITCNREVAKFDGSFDTWAFLDEYLLYFPETDGFLKPDKFELRYPLIPQDLSGHKGLFVEPVAVGELKTGITWVRDIPALPYTAGLDNLDIDVRFPQGLELNQIRHQRTFVGYEAAAITPYYNTMSEEQRKKFVEEMFNTSIPDLKLEKWTVTPSTVGLMPGLAIDANYSTNHFLEKAGPKFLFKVGELIGPQSELYREENRQTPIENTHNRGYSRIIRLHIPEGYAISNLEALNFHVEYKDGDHTPFSFVSTYSLKGDIVTVNIEEFYKEIYAPLERYEDFRKVVNAAADFNKVVLILSKS